MKHRETFPEGYVKVELRSRLPKLWGWTLCRNGNGTVFELSTELFKYSEDAWQAGQRALKASLNLAHSS